MYSVKSGHSERWAPKASRAGEAQAGGQAEPEGWERPWVKTKVGHTVCKKEHQTWSPTIPAQLLFQSLMSCGIRV